MRKLILPTLLFAASFAGCEAPQGKKLAYNEVLAPVAVGPAAKATTLTIDQAGEFVAMHPGSTLTVKLPANYRGGFQWRLSEIPDPAVLKVSSPTFTPPAGNSPAEPGEQTYTFEATGVGDVRVPMWYGTLWASDMAVKRSFEFTASVTPEEKAAKKSKKKSHKKS
jgi:predicted secreted protein